MAHMKTSNRLKVVMEEGKAAFGCWQMAPGSNVARTLARTGVDFVVVDCEHGNIDDVLPTTSSENKTLKRLIGGSGNMTASKYRCIDLLKAHGHYPDARASRGPVQQTPQNLIANLSTDAAMHEAVPAIAACGVSPIVRIPDNQGYMVKRALDSGAHGVLVPLLYTVEDARRLVRSAKFPPQGNRGFGSPFPQERFNPLLGATDYLQQANDSILTIVQIETKEALDDVEAIAAVPGIDVLFVGPFDLGNNIGHPIIDGKMHENLITAIDQVMKAANSAGKKAGIFCTSGEQGRIFAEKGFQMVSCATDIFVLAGGVMSSLATAKDSGPAPKMQGYGS